MEEVNLRRKCCNARPDPSRSEHRGRPRPDPGNALEELGIRGALVLRWGQQLLQRLIQFREVLNRSSCTIKVRTTCPRAWEALPL